MSSSSGTTLDELGYTSQASAINNITPETSQFRSASSKSAKNLTNGYCSPLSDSVEELETKSAYPEDIDSTQMEVPSDCVWTTENENSGGDSCVPCTNGETAIESNLGTDDWGWATDNEESEFPASSCKESVTLLEKIDKRSFCVSVASSSQFIASAYAIQTGTVWNGAVAIHFMDDKMRLKRISSTSLACSISAVDFLENNTLLAAGDNGTLLSVHLPNELSKDEYYRDSGILKEACEHDGVITGLKISTNKTRAVSCDTLGFIKVWDPVVLGLMRSVQGHWPHVDGISIHPEKERYFVTNGGICKQLKFWNDGILTSVLPTNQLFSWQTTVSSMNWFDTNSLLLGTNSGTVSLIDLRNTKELIWQCPVSSDKIKCGVIQTCYAGIDSIFSISEDNCLRKFSTSQHHVTSKWQLTSPSLSAGRINDYAVTDMCLAFDRKNVICCCRDHNLWTIENDQLLNIPLNS